MTEVSAAGLGQRADGRCHRGGRRGLHRRDHHGNRLVRSSEKGEGDVGNGAMVVITNPGGWVEGDHQTERHETRRPPRCPPRAPRCALVAKGESAIIARREGRRGEPRRRPCLRFYLCVLAAYLSSLAAPSVCLPAFFS